MLPSQLLSRQWLLCRCAAIGAAVGPASGRGAPVSGSFVESQVGANKESCSLAAPCVAPGEVLPACGRLFESLWSVMLAAAADAVACVSAVAAAAGKSGCLRLSQPVCGRVYAQQQPAGHVLITACGQQ